MIEEEMVRRQTECIRICRLFRAVLQKAVSDAFGPKCRLSKRRKLKEKARAFLSDNEDFRLICKMAFVDPMWILSVVEQPKLKNKEKYEQILLNIKDNYYYF